VTKPITVVAALMLWEEGGFLLDDPIADYLPELAGMQVLRGVQGSVPLLESPRGPITIRHLMTHTSGMTYGIFGPENSPRADRQRFLRAGGCCGTARHPVRAT